MLAAAVGLSATLLAGCGAAQPLHAATPPDSAPANPGRTAAELLAWLLPTPLLLVGEQHDAPEHQALQRELVHQLAASARLAALVLEMADQGVRTTGLPTDASEGQVRQALRWTNNGGGWPWPVYGPLVMAAVRAGVPVLGGNLPRGQMRAAMGDNALDQLLKPAALAQQQQDIREGHCGLLPEGQIAPMTRIQIARDRAMAETAVAASHAGQTVLLVAGNGHVRRDLGVPQHLPAGLGHRVVMAQAGPAPAPGDQADTVWPTPPRPPTDHCAEITKQMGR